MDNLGATDFFGLDERGRPDGNAMLGAVVGTGLGSVTAIGVRRYGGKYAKYGELFGMGASVAAGAVLYFTGQKSSGMTAAIAGLLNNGLRALEQQMFAPAGAKLFGGMVFTPTQALEGGGRQMGMIDIEPTQALSGPVADYSQMPQLVGASLQSAADHIQLVGGPQLSQHSGAWGATVMGGGH